MAVIPHETDKRFDGISAMGKAFCFTKNVPLGAVFIATLSSRMHEARHSELRHLKACAAAIEASSAQRQHSAEAQMPGIWVLTTPQGLVHRAAVFVHVDAVALFRQARTNSICNGL